MKIICVKIVEGTPQFYIKCETTQIRNNEPLYVPFFCEELCCEFAFAVKINRVTKAIAENFASRCWNEYSVVTNFWSENLARKQRAEGGPMEIAYSFDRSFALENEFHLMEEEPMEGDVFVNGVSVKQLKWGDVAPHIDRVVASISSYVTLKIGDVIMVSLDDDKYQLAIGDRVEIKMNEEIIVETQIK